MKRQNVGGQILYVAPKNGVYENLRKINLQKFQKIKK